MLSAGSEAEETDLAEALKGFTKSAVRTSNWPMLNTKTHLVGGQSRWERPLEPLGLSLKWIPKSHSASSILSKLLGPTDLFLVVSGRPPIDETPEDVCCIALLLYCCFIGLFITYSFY
jgi:hypothetical protein